MPNKERQSGFLIHWSSECFVFIFVANGWVEWMHDSLMGVTLPAGWILNKQWNIQSE